MSEPPTGSRPEDEPKPLNEFDEQHPPAKSAGPLGPGGALPYESPLDRARREPPLNVLANTITCAVGFAATAAAVLFFSAFLYMAVNPNFMGHGDASDHPFSRVFAAVYLLLFAGAIYGIVRLFRKPRWREVGRWWTLGALLGAGAGMLLEGICFAAT
jgi:hypothetical protein